MRWLPLYLVLAMLLPQCGGGGAGTEPKTAAERESDDSERSGDDSKSADSESEAASGVEEKSPGPSCDDGTCTLCGSGICPTGWYCDESAPGGSACAWLKE